MSEVNQEVSLYDPVFLTECLFLMEYLEFGIEEEEDFQRSNPKQAFLLISPIDYVLIRNKYSFSGKNT